MSKVRVAHWGSAWASVYQLGSQAFTCSVGGADAASSSGCLICGSVTMYWLANTRCRRAARVATAQQRQFYLIQATTQSPAQSQKFHLEAISRVTACATLCHLSG